MIEQLVEGRADVRVETLDLQPSDQPLIIPQGIRHPDLPRLAMGRRVLPGQIAKNGNCAMNVLILGAGQVGRTVLQSLAADFNMNVTMVDIDPHALKEVRAMHSWQHGGWSRFQSRRAQGSRHRRLRRNRRGYRKR